MYLSIYLSLYKNLKKKSNGYIIILATSFIKYETLRPRIVAAYIKSWAEISWISNKRNGWNKDGWIFFSKNKIIVSAHLFGTWK